MYARIVKIILAGAMAIGAVADVQAQVATPTAESLFAGLSLPEITVTATDDGLDVSQREVPAGRYVVTLDNQSEDSGLVVEIARLMEDVSTTEPSCPTMLPPECLIWYHQTYLPGGVSGQSQQAILNFPAGEYGLWETWAESVEPEAMLTVTGDSDAAIDGPEPEAAAIIVTKGEDGYGLSIRVEGQLHPGPQVIKTVNAANQPLYIAAAQNPESINADQVAGTVTSDPSSDNAASLDAFNDMQFGRVVSTDPQSANSTQWVAMDLTPGPVYVAGYLPDPITIEEGSSGWYAATAVVVPVAEP